MSQEQFKSDLTKVMIEIENLLIEKNRKYGDAALNPNRTFASAPASELIRVRIDDKLSRIKNRQGDDFEDAELDLLGYLILLRIAKLREQRPIPPAPPGPPSRVVHEI